MPSITLKTSNTPGAVPTGLVPGEIALNTADGKTFIGDAAGDTIVLTGTVAKYPSNNVNFSDGSINNTTIGASTASTLSTSNLQVNGGQTVSSVSDNSALGSSDSVLTTNAAVNNYLETNKSAELKSITTFTGNGTYNKSGSDVAQIRVICIGGGGGGRGYGESGGGGGFSERWIDGSSITGGVSVTIGGRGAGGVYYGYSDAGGTTSFGGFCSATGGFGANNNQDHTGGHGGIGSGGNINWYGGGGVGHHNCHTSSYHNPGHGGASYFGGAQAGNHYTLRSADTGGFGSGGTGSNWYNNGANFYDRGYDGQSGVCIVYEYK